MISSFAEFLKRCKEEELQARAAKAERLRKVFTENNYDSGDSLVSALLLVEDLKIRRRVEFDPLPAFQHCHISAIFLVIFSSCQDETAPPEEVKAVSSARTKLLAELVRVVRSVRRWAGDGPEMGRRRLEHSANSESRRILLFSMVFHVEKCRFPRGLKYMGEVMMFWRYGWT